MRKGYEEIIIGYLSGELTDDEQQEFAEALKTDPQCRERYDELVKLYASSSTLRFEEQKEENYTQLRKRLGIGERANEERRLAWCSLRRIASVAAIFLLVAGLGYYVVKDITTPALAGNEITVPLGSQTKIMLPDGSAVWLNSGSILQYDENFGRRDRNVKLVGEGYFEVVKDARRTFTVNADELYVEVLGTKFNVRAYPGDDFVDVSLIEGAVRTYTLDSATPVDSRLYPDNLLSYDKRSGRVEIAMIEARKTAQWVEGRLCFVNTPLAEILRDIERAYNVRIEIKSDKIYRESFSGSVGLDMTIDEILNYIDVDKKYVWTLNHSVLTLEDKR